MVMDGKCPVQTYLLTDSHPKFRDANAPKISLIGHFFKIRTTKYLETPGDHVLETLSKVL